MNGSVAGRARRVGRAGYRPRIVDAELHELLANLPAVSVEGPKGVGKTETARQWAASRHELDRPGASDLVEADPDRLVRGAEPILIDEWQRYPRGKRANSGPPEECRRLRMAMGKGRGSTGATDVGDGPSQEAGPSG